MHLYFKFQRGVAGSIFEQWPYAFYHYLMSGESELIQIAFETTFKMFQSVSSKHSLLYATARSFDFIDCGTPGKGYKNVHIF